jgi:hypothetical protein
MPGTSVLAPYHSPAIPPNSTVLATPTSATTRSVRSSNGITARFNGMVSDTPARPSPSSRSNVRGSTASSHSTAV